MKTSRKGLVLFLVAGAIGCGMVLSERPTQPRAPTVSHSPAISPAVSATRRPYASSLAAWQPSELVDWRRAANVQRVRENDGFIVDRATLAWLPREFGLEEGDAILSINGESITSVDQIIDAVKGSSEGSAVEFQIRIAGTVEAVRYSVAR